MTNQITAPEGARPAGPGDPGYAEAVAAYNLAVPVTPRAAVTVTDVDGVARALASARERGLGVRVLATGHAVASASAFGDDLLVRVALDAPVEVDPGSRTATIPAGKTWAEVAAAAAPHGLASLHGSSGTVSAIGYLLGGGLSFYGREHGVAANTVVAFDVVLADGSLVTASDDENADLFFALRGGGAGLGVVVCATVRLIAAPQVLTGASMWSAEHAPYLLEAWERWAADAPRSASTSFRILNLPPVPGVPPVLTTGPVVCIDGAVLDDDEATAAEVAAGLLAPLRAHAEPLLDTWHVGPATDLLETHMDPVEPAPFATDHLVVGELGAHGREAFLAVAGSPEGSSVMIVELRQLGGAFAEGGRGGAVDSVAGAYAYGAIAVLFDPAVGPAAESQMRALREQLAPYATGFAVPTFAGAETRERFFDDETAQRVVAVRLRVDPDGLFAGDRAVGT